MFESERDEAENNDILKKCALNSIFELLKTKTRRTTLEIVPQKHSNIGRFLNSVGLNSKKKQNVI